MNWQKGCHRFTQSNPSLAITKYQFSGLLNEAWGKTMNPATICSRFRKCGVYPFNPSAIDCSFSVVNPEASPRQSNTKIPSDHNIDINENTPPEINDSSNVSSEKLSLYQRRFEEEYDLPDEEYTKWLKVNHPGGTIQ